MTNSFDPNVLDLPKGHFIGGEYHVASSDQAHTLVRPSDGQPHVDVPIASADVVERAVEVAKRTQRESGWATCRPRDRVNAMHHWADLLQQNATRLARLEAFCSTRPITATVEAEVASAAEHIRFFAEMADKEGGATVPTAGDQFGMTLSEPYGVVGAIAPWNFPISMASWKLAPAVAAGNAIVLKPSEMTPMSALYMAELSVRAGLPEGLINVVLGDGPTTGAAITGHGDVAKVSFTGSVRAGQAIMTNIARTGIKPMTLELGGKSPQIVFADADLDLATRCVAGPMLSNAGQVCNAGSRLLVAKEIAEDMIDRLCARMSGARAGATWDGATTYSPIISDPQRQRIHSIIRAAVGQGAEILLGGHPMEGPGYFYEPTILSDLDNDNIALREEIFGPVLCIQTFTSEDEALQLANDTSYGLAAGVFTRDLSRALRMTRALDAGTVWVNRFGRSGDHILPTGGYKQSGIGKDLGKEAYQANRQKKAVLIGL